MNPAIEREYLAAAMLNPSVLEEHPLRDGDIASAELVHVFRAMTSLHSQGRPCDPFAVIDWLRERGELRERMERQIVDLSAHESSGVLDIASVAAELRRAGMLGRMRQHLTEAVMHLSHGRAEEAAIESSKAQDALESEHAIHSAHDIQVKAIEAVANMDRSTQLRSGFATMDKSIGHLDPGDMLVIAADTSVGKTSMVLASAMELARRGTPVGIVSCEDSLEKLGGRLLGLNAHVAPLQLRRGRIDQGDQDRITQAVKDSQQLPLYIAAPIGGTDLEVSELMARMVRQHGCRMLFVDYVQTINTAAPGHTRRDDVRRVASRLKGTASRTGAALVLTSQVSRPPADRRDKPRKPTRFDLKEAGELENMAEYVVILWPFVKEVGNSKIKGVEVQDRNRVNAVLDKSKVGGEGVEWVMRRNDFGVLVEEEQRYDDPHPPPDESEVRYP